MEKMQETFNKGLEELKNKQTEVNNTLEGINSRITGRMDKWPGRESNGNYGCKIKCRKKNEKKWRQPKNVLENIKCTNICIIGVPEGEEREKGPKKVFEEVRAENFPNMGKEIVNQVQEAQKSLPRQEKPKEEYWDT